MLTTAASSARDLQLRYPVPSCPHPLFDSSDPGPPALPTFRTGSPISGDSRERAAIGVSADNGI